MAIFDFRFHHPNPWIDDLLHGDHTHTDDDGNEVISPGTPDRPVVIDPDPEPDPAPNPNPGPAPDPEPEDDPVTLIGDDSDEHLEGGDNDDSIQGRGGHDVLIGGPGNDEFHGGLGDDVLIGGPGDDSLTAGAGHYDLLIGGPGDDHLDSHGPDVVMIGGPGRDVFDLRFLLTETGAVDDHGARIMDFQDGVDRILIRHSVWDLADTGAARLEAFYNRVMEAGLTFDMRWIASELDRDVVVELADDTITIVNTDLAELQLAVIDDGLFIV